MTLIRLTTIVLLAASAARADELFEGAPPAPPGYETHVEAQRAVMTGEVPAVRPFAEVPEDVTFHDDLVYAEPDGTELSLDLYVPQDAGNPPLLIFIHGGGWSGGKKEDYAYYNIKFAQQGYATASIQYRLSGVAKFPAAIQDVECAIAWLAARGEEYGYDGDTLVTIGGSAGGHLSMLAGYSQDESLLCPGGEDTPITAVVNIYGVYDCTTEVAKEASQVRRFIGGTWEEKEELYRLCSPMHHLDENDPPTLTFHGTVDELVPVNQADRLHEHLDTLGIANHYDRIEGWPHSMDLAQPVNDRMRYILAKFLEKYVPLKE